MAKGVEQGEARLAWIATLLLLVGATVRLLTALVAGFVEWHQVSFPVEAPGRAEAFDVLTTFGAGGDGTGALLALALAASVWWLSRLGHPRGATVAFATQWVVGVTAVLALLQAVGVGILFSLDQGDQWSRIIQNEGEALAYLVLAIGGLLVVRRLAQVVDEMVLGDNDVDAFVFAVDRSTGDVRAYLSMSEARRRMHIYSVEGDEFAFYTDEGVVLDAEVVDGRIGFRPTDDVQSQILLEKLKDFTNRREILVDPDDADDPAAYAGPISEWHRTDLWPHWMRGFRWLFRRTR